MEEKEKVPLGHFASYRTFLIIMNIFEVGYCRIYQFFLNKIAMPFLPFPKQEVLQGNSSLLELPSLLEKKGIKKPFIFVSNSVSKTSHYQKFVTLLMEKGFPLLEFKEVKQNPETPVIEKAAKEAKEKEADALIAIGGGSIIDTAKAVGAMLANPKKKLLKMRGLLKVRKRFPMLIAIPTTAGSGSEATIASVVTNPSKKDKFAINSPKLLPQIVLLDDELLRSLPPKIIANTGMDALTHALEAYLGNALTRKTKEAALESILLISASLLPFYQNPNDDVARENMLKASYLAGIAFTRSYVGYVHALAHSLGGEYNLPHGYLNAVLLPHLLRKYGKKSSKKLSYLAEILNLDNSKKETAVIEYIEDLKEKLNIPKTFGNIIQEKDIPYLAKHAAKEANPLYPVPKEMNQKELAEILKELSI